MEDETKEYIASQQNLFSSVENKTSFKNYDDNNTNDEVEENDSSFMQFDLFNQNINVLKQSNAPLEKVEKYENKYKSFDNLNNEIEPERKLDISSLKNEKKITRSEDKKKSKINVNSSLLSLVGENSQSRTSDNEVKTTQNPSVISDETKKVEVSNSSNIESVKIDKAVNKNQSSNEDENKIKNNETTIFQNNDYKIAIGKLYNDAKRSDPYEANKYKSFKELFPNTEISENKENSRSKIDEMISNTENGSINCGDFETLNNLYSLQGITIHSHKSISKDVKTKTYTDKNKINMFTTMLTSFIMLMEIILTYIFVKNTGNFAYRNSLIYFIAGGISVGMVIVSVLENFFDRYKLLIIKPNFKKQITARILIFIILTIVVFALCLAFGMKSLGDSNFISFWLIPVLCASNIVVYFLIYSFFLNQKYFNS